MQTVAETHGILFTATGQRYNAAAIGAAESVRRVSPNLPIALRTDLPDAVPCKLFDHIGKIENGHKRSKVDHLAESPFMRTLYLDTDIRVLKDVTEVFTLLDRFDIALAHAHSRNRALTNQKWRMDLPHSFPQLNGGVILYRKNEAVMNFLADWSKSYREAGFKKDQVTLRELLWRSDLRLYVLPPEYNLRYLRYVYFWGAEEAQPIILHLRRYHDRGQSRKKVFHDRAKELSRDVKAALRALGGAAKQIFFLGGKSKS
jgi:hypothetical protein